MGNLFRSVEKHLVVNDREVFVEIGTARGSGGSTQYFDQLARQHNTKLHTVDIDSREYILQYTPNTIGYQMSGSMWAQDVFPLLDKHIACLYLDNYDYNYWIGDNCEMIQSQKTEYQEKYNIVLSNNDCQVEHLKQMISLLPFISDTGIIVCDDTYLYNDCWIGKCGAVVVYLLANNYKIVEIDDVQGQSYGVILKRG